MHRVASAVGRASLAAEATELGPRQGQPYCRVFVRQVWPCVDRKHCAKGPRNGSQGCGAMTCSCRVNSAISAGRIRCCERCAKSASCGFGQPGRGQAPGTMPATTGEVAPVSTWLLSTTDHAEGLSGRPRPQSRRADRCALQVLPCGPRGEMKSAVYACAGRAATWPCLCHSWPPSIWTRQPPKRFVTGFIGSRKATASDLTLACRKLALELKRSAPLRQQRFDVCSRRRRRLSTRSSDRNRPSRVGESQCVFHLRAFRQ